MSTTDPSPSNVIANPLSPAVGAIRGKAQLRSAARASFPSLLRKGLAIGAIALAALWLGSVGLHAYRYATTDNAYVVGHLHEISTQVDGRVEEVLVTSNQVVKVGDPLVRLDELPFKIAMQRADAAVAQARANEEQLASAASVAAAKRAEAVAHVALAQAQINQAKAQFELSQSGLNRAERLMQAGGVSTQVELDNARAARNGAQAALDAASADLAASQAAVASADATIASANSEIAAARAATAASQADLDEARRRLSETTVTAPADGHIGNRNVETGNRVQAGQALLALAENVTWVIANFKETDVGRFKPGQPAELTIDALPGIELHGTIDSISPASGAQFALLPPDNATGNFTKVVQRVPVKITLDEASRNLVGSRLRLGYSVVVRIKIR